MLTPHTYSHRFCKTCKVYDIKVTKGRISTASCRLLIDFCYILFINAYYRRCDRYSSWERQEEGGGRFIFYFLQNMAGAGPVLFPDALVLRK